MKKKEPRLPETLFLYFLAYRIWFGSWMQRQERVDPQAKAYKSYVERSGWDP